MPFPFWKTRTPGLEAPEDAASRFLHRAWSRAEAEGRIADAKAIKQEMTTPLPKARR